MKKPLYIGAGGGKQPAAPTITNDNLFSKDRVEILLGVGEGPLLGLEDGLKSFFAGEVPLQANDGNPIIKDLNAQPYNGSATATNIVFDLGGESANVSVGVNILNKSPVVRYTPENYRGKINKLQIRINIAQLFQEDSNGGVSNNIAEFRIEYKSARGNDPWIVLDFGNATPVGSSFVPPLSNLISFSVASHTDSKNKYQLYGKTGSGFIIDFKVDVSTLADDDYMIRVTKFNPDTNNAENIKIACDIVFDSFQIIAQESRSFTNTALMHVRGRANDQFSDIPDFYGIYKGLLTKTPSNRVEDAVGAACYVGSWNGALVPAYHSNPAWVLYDLLDNPRYGMRRYAPTLNIYTQDFYDAGAYCDNGILNNLGTAVEKRYTMNITLAENQNGWETLQNLAGAFDAVVFDDGEGNVRLKVDRWVEPRVLFTPETVTVEGFNYSFTDINTQYNSITVSFTNPERGWQETRLKVQSETDINQNGEIPLDFVAVGCTSESEALRRARARLFTATTEKIITAFTTTRLGLILDPLEIVYVADPLLGWGYTGRIQHVNGLEIFLRDPLDIQFNTEAELILQTTTGLFQGVVIMRNRQLLEVVTNTSQFLTAYLPEYAQFTLQNFTTMDGRQFRSAKPFRITAIEPSKDYNTYQLTALEVNKAKYDVVSNANHINITVDRDVYTGINLRQLVADNLIPLDREYQSATITFDGTLEQQQGSFLLICAANVNGYALTVGDWTGLLPVGVRPKIVFKGAVKVMGRGGKGGQGGFAYGQPLGADRQLTLFLGHGEDGEDGGQGSYWDYPVEVELSQNANVELLGGYGGGYGGRAGLLITTDYFDTGTTAGNSAVTPYPVPLGEAVGALIGFLGSTTGRISDYTTAYGQVFLLTGAGAGGGWPFGLGGASGKDVEQTLPPNIGAYGQTQNIGGQITAAGGQGTKEAAGLSNPSQVYTWDRQRQRANLTTNLTIKIRNGEGQNGQPSAVFKNPTPSLSFISLGAQRYNFIPSSTGNPTNGVQGIGVINAGNMITNLGSGSVLTYNTSSGYTTLTG